MNRVDSLRLNAIEKDEKIRAEVGDGDQVDALPEKPFFTCLDFFGSIGAIVAFYFDIITDVALMWFYYDGRHYIYFALTMTFVVLPALLTNIISMKWYLSDAKKKEIPSVSPLMWSLRIFSHLLLMGPAWRSLESLHFGLKSVRSKSSKRRRGYYNYMTYIDADNSLLKLLEAFTESAPQLVLQLFILITEAQVFRDHIETGFFYFRQPHLKNSPGNAASLTGANDSFILKGPKATVVFQVLSVSSALLSLSLSLTIYSRNNRFSQPNKANISLLGSFFIFCWRLLTVGARVLALSLFASVFPNLWFLVVLVIRWIVMSTWIITIRASLCHSNCLQHSFELVLGLVYLFTYINLKDDATRRKYLFYYSYEMIEDAILVALWAWLVDPISTYFYWCALICHFGGVALGLTCMFVYYAQFHPNGPRNDIGAMCLNALLPPPSDSDETKQNGGVVQKFKRAKMPTSEA